MTGRKRRRRASYTIEASLLIPLFLMLIAVAMETGIVLYQETAASAEQEGLAEVWAVEDFYRLSPALALKETLAEGRDGGR